jgi:3-deoxy-D-manno-octulosonic-acid transferase
MPSVPFSLRAYRYATLALEPIAPFALRRRARQGKEDFPRLPERLGIPNRPRPEGELVWIHGASVGECLSVLPLVDALLRTPRRSVLVTSGTVTSAGLMAERLPPRAFHQFAPVDTPNAVARFLTHWHPDIGLFVDSEIWPNLLANAHALDIPLAIINGRMSAKSFTNWRYARSVAAAVFSLYDLCLVQDQETAARFKALGATNVQVTGSLKADALPLPADPARLHALRSSIAQRPVLLAASMHAGEDEIILSAHDVLHRQFSSLLTIIVPRHPSRGAQIAMLCGPRAVTRRSQTPEPDNDTTVYIADTIGELGLFYRATSFAFIGGSLVQHGGQNPLEAANLGSVILAGPYTDNFRQAYDTVFASQGLGRVASSADIATLAAQFFADPRGAQAIGEAARNAVRSLGGAVARTHIAVESMLRSHARA